MFVYVYLLFQGGGERKKRKGILLKTKVKIEVKKYAHWEKKGELERHGKEEKHRKLLGIEISNFSNPTIYICVCLCAFICVYIRDSFNDI